MVVPRAPGSSARARPARHVDQMGCPEGPSAECPSDIRSLHRRPVRSPPCRETAPAAGRRARVAADVGRVLHRDSPCANRAPIVWTRAVSSPSIGSKVTPPGTRTPGDRGTPQRHHHGGQPLSQVATRDPRRVGRDRIRREIPWRVVRKGRLSNIAVVPATGRRRDRCRRGKRHGSGALEYAGRRLHQQATSQCSGVVARRLVCRLPRGCRRGWTASGIPGRRARREPPSFPRSATTDRSPDGRSRIMSAVNGSAPRARRQRPNVGQPDRRLEEVFVTPEVARIRIHSRRRVPPVGLHCSFWRASLIVGRQRQRRRFASAEWLRPHPLQAWLPARPQALATVRASFADPF